MKYNGFYFWLFSKPMKQMLSEKYNRQYAHDIMKKSKRIYRELVQKADDIGDDNPMAYNELFALSFIAPYVASSKQIPPETVQEMMRRSLYHVKWYFGKTDLNTEKGKAENKKSIVQYVKWYTPEKERQYARKGAAIPYLLSGGFCWPALRGRMLLSHHPLPHLRIRTKVGRFEADAAVL